MSYIQQQQQQQLGRLIWSLLKAAFYLVIYALWGRKIKTPAEPPIIEPPVIK